MTGPGLLGRLAGQRPVTSQVSRLLDRLTVVLNRTRAARHGCEMALRGRRRTGRRTTDRRPQLVPVRCLVAGKAADRLDWAQAHEALAQAGLAGEAMVAEDLELQAAAAYLVGEVADCLQTMQRAHQVYADAGNRSRAVRMLFWLGFVLLSQGERAQAGGWLARASRLLKVVRPDCAQHGLLLIPQVIQASELGDHAASAAAAAAVVEIGSRTGDPEVRALALHWQGRAMVRDGQLPEGLVLLDESMTAVVAGEVAPYVAGSLYCSMIDACREIADIRRAHEWMVALTTWCDQQPGMLTFSGRCLVHRAEIVRLRGQWPEAVEEARRACERFAYVADQYATGMVWYRMAEIYRAQGMVTEAEAAYRRAGEWGHDPQSVLALLWLAGHRTGRSGRPSTVLWLRPLTGCGVRRCCPLRSRLRWRLAMSRLRRPPLRSRRRSSACTARPSFGPRPAVPGEPLGLPPVTPAARWPRSATLGRCGETWTRPTKPRRSACS